MMPFAFAVPFTSRMDPTAIFTSATPVADKRRSAENRPENQLKSKKASKSNWKSKLRQPHPFTSREPVTPSLARSQTSNEKQGRTKDSRSLTAVRRIYLYTILSFSFIVLVLGLVYAGDVATPDVEAANITSVTLPARPTEVGTTNPISRREILENLVRDLSTDVETQLGETIVGEPSIAENLGPFAPTSSADGSSSADNTSSPVTTESAFEAAQLRAPSAVAALFFYVATIPLLSILFASVELVVLHLLAASTRRSKAASSATEADESFDSDAETLSEEEKQKWQHIGPSNDELPDRKETKIEKLRPHAPLLSVLTGTMILEGWIVINGIQTHCELVSAAGSGVCPIQTRNQLGGGTHVLSIIKLVIAWLLVAIQLVYIVLVLRDTKLFSRSKSSSSDVENRSRRTSLHSKPSSLKNRSRNASPRKSVRFNVEDEALERQRHGNDGIEYIPASFDPDAQLGQDGTTPWQWQSQSADENSARLTEGSSAGVGYGRNASTLHPATESTPDSPQSLALPNILSHYNTRGGSFDFGLASVRQQILNSASTGRRSLDSQQSGSRPVSVSSSGSQASTKRRPSSISNTINGRKSVDVHRVSTIEEEGMEPNQI